MKQSTNGLTHGASAHYNEAMNAQDRAKHLILGTAGHVDHGKTTLIKAMTGVNTDRLKEEQERGLTIDLGFASLKLPSGREIGIVDVPGHEKFLKNMLAGASGVDIALLVVAADEGVMPQTHEHLDILELLETRLSVVALTKCDMVEEDWLDIVEEDLAEYLKNTSFRSAKIVRVSGTTGQGVDALIAEIDRLADMAEQRAIEGPFRLPVDRVFTMTGFGTVVTGTLASGTIRLGDPVTILPQGIASRVRQIQVHGKKQDAAYAGSRVAANLVGVEVSDIERGSVVLPPGYLCSSSTLDVSVSVLKNSPRPLKSRMRIRMHIGTAEAIGRVMILGKDEIAAGEKGLLQLRMESDIVAARGDRFVLRFYSPARVLGGGIILDPNAAKHRRMDNTVLQRLERTLKGEPSDIVEDALASSETGLIKKDIVQRTGLGDQEVNAVLVQLVADGRVLELPGRFVHKPGYVMLASRIKTALAAYHKAHAMKPGMFREELKAAVGPRIDQKGFQAILASVASSGEVAVSETTVRLPGHAPTLDPRQEELLAKIESAYRDAGANPPLLHELERTCGDETREIAALLLGRGELVKIDTDLYFHKSAVESAETALRKYLQENGQITVAQFRDLIGSSRKYVVPLLEYFDSKRLTRRAGDQRVLFGR
ncbi:MAG: selenocysteine-specific translation elongation factor [Armatimonadota bacterium]